MPTFHFVSAGGGAGFTTIQAAINAASDGDTIIVDSGVYIENLDIDKAVTILGAREGDSVTAPNRFPNGFGETTIKGASKITAGGAVNIDGVRFLNDGTTTGGSFGAPALFIQTSGGDPGHTIENTIFYSTVAGGNVNDVAILISTLASGHVHITDNLITGSQNGQFATASWGRGIWTDGGGVDLDITGNIIQNTRSALNVDNAGDGEIDISGNTFKTVGSALSVGVDSPDNLDVSNNTFENVGTDFNFRNLTTDVTFDAAPTIGTLTPVGDNNDFVVVLGGAGKDDLKGTAGKDYITGNDISATNTDNDTIDGRGGADTLLGRGGDDTLKGGAGADSLDGGDNNDDLIGGADNDTINGGAGSDVAVFSGNFADYNVSGLTFTAGVVSGLVSGTDGDDTLSNIEVLKFGNEFHVLNGMSIQAAINAAEPGDTIIIGAGTFKENINVNKAGLIITGAGDSTVIDGTFHETNGNFSGTIYDFLKGATSYSGAAGAGLTISANGVQISNLKITDFLHGVALGNTDGSSLEDVTIAGNVIGIEKISTSTVTDFSINDGSISDGYIGIDVPKAAVGGGNLNGFTLDGTTFIDLLRKGIYAETLSNADIKNFSMDHVGQWGNAEPFGVGQSGFGGNGINLNLKYGTYQNVVIENFSLNNTGASDRDGAAAVGHKNGGAIVIEVRDDAPSYTANPASFTGAVVIQNGAITGQTSTGIQVGEPGKTNAGPAVNVTGVTINGAEHNANATAIGHGDLSNASQSILSYIASANDDTIVVNPLATGKVNIDGAAGNDTLTGGGGNDKLEGGIGNDVLDGKGGSNELIGGADNDTYYARAGDTVTEALNGGTDTVISGGSIVLSANVENATLLDGASNTQTFSDLPLGLIADGANGWKVFGNAAQHAVVDVNGNKMLQASSDPSNGAFGGPFTPGLSASAGEAGAGAMFQQHTISFDFKAVDPGGDNSRLEVDFANAVGNDRVNFMAIESIAGGGIRILTADIAPNGTFIGGGSFPTDWRTIVANVDSSVSHHLELKLNYVDGANNDIIQIYLDGQLVGTASTFENYFDAQPASLGHNGNAVINFSDRILFRGNANGAPNDGAGGQNQGFYFDNVKSAVSNPEANLTGNALANILTGNSEDNSLTGAGDNDTLIGNGGIDTAIYSGPITTAMLSNNGTQWTVNAGVAEGTDTLNGVEKVSSSSGTILLVGAGGYATIQEAINAASSGDTILVADGEYSENPVISTAGIKILAAGDGAEIHGGITINANDVTIDGFTIDGSVAGNEDSSIFVLANGAVITNNTITADAHAATGIVIGISYGDATIDGNTISGFDFTGIYVNPTSVDPTSVTNNTFEDNGEGVIFEAGPSVNEVSGNEFSGSTTNDIRVSLRESGTYDLGGIISNNDYSGGTVREVNVRASGDSTVTGTDQADRIEAMTAGSYEAIGQEVSFNGGDGNDTLIGGAGGDSLKGSAGADALEGNGGTDTAVYTSIITTDMLSNDGTQWTVTTPGGEGTDTLKGVEIIDGGGTGGNILLVGSGGFATIQEAINAAADGDIIKVSAGTYTENLNINKAVTISGAHGGEAGTAGTRDAANGVGETTIIGRSKITAAGDVTVDGVRFVNNGTTTGGGPSNPTLQITTGYDHTVTNSVFYSAVLGAGADDRAISLIVLADGDITISNNLITGITPTNLFAGATWGRGIWSDGGGTDLTVSGNTIEFARSAMNLDMTGVTTATVTGNTFKSDGSALSVGVDKDGLTINNNTFQNVGTEVNFRNLGDVTFDVAATNSSVTPAVPANPGNDLFAVLGGNGADTLSGSALGDLLDGNNLSPSNVDIDVIDGRAGNDFIYGKAGDDTLTGGAGNDTIDGGAGTGDTAVFSGDRFDYSVAFNSTTGTYTITDLRANSPDGTDSITGVEKFKFGGVTIDVANVVNSAPTDIAIDNNEIAENSATGDVIGTLTTTDADSGVGDTATYSLVDDFDGKFAIVGDKLVVGPNAGLDYETTTSYDVEVEVTDSEGLTFTKTITVEITDENDNDPIIGSGVTASEAENTSAPTVVYTIVAADADGTAANNTITYSISGDDAALFNVDAMTGQVTFKNAPNFEAPADLDGDNVYDIVVHASDGTNEDNQAVAITVTDVNDNSPVINSGATATKVENTSASTAVYTIAATDADGTSVNNTITYSISGDDAALFNVNSATGAVTFKVTPDFDAPTDADGHNDYELTVEASDGTNVTTKDVTITVTDANDNAPVIASGATGTKVENTAASTAVYTIVATDADGTTPNNTIVYSISGTDAALFNVNASNGQVTFKNSPNFEAPADNGGNNVYDIVVHASDGPNEDTQTVAISVTDANDNSPVITSGATATVAENAPASTIVYDANATDADGTSANNTLVYSLTGVDAALFSINSANGQVRFLASPDFEDPQDDGDNNVYDIVVNVTDGVTSDTQAVAITVTNGDGNTIVGTSGGDTINGTTPPGAVSPSNPATPTNVATPEADTISGGGGNDTIDGLGGNDTLNGGIGIDTLIGNEGNDLLIGGAGADIIIGGNGTDTVSYAGSASGVIIDLDSQSVSQGDAAGETISSIENAIGGNGNDIITGSSFANRLEGGAGNDFINADDGNDTIVGGAGVDTLYGNGDDDTFLLSGTGDATDNIYGGSGSDTVKLDGTGPVTLAGTGKFSGIEILDGAGHALVGSTGADNFNLSTYTVQNLASLDGGLGDDVIVGSNQALDLRGGAGKDTITGGSAGDTINGGAGVDTLNGGSGDDTFVVSGTEGSGDGLNGGADNDTLKLIGTTAVTLNAFNAAIASIERLEFANNGKGIIGSGTADTFNFAAIAAMVGAGFIDGGAGNDIITGSATVGMDLRGGAGNDTINGGAGDDTITGGAGLDTLNGGAGNDTFIVSGTDGATDVINGGANTDTLKLVGTTGTVTLNGFDAGASSIEALEFTNFGRVLFGSSANTTFNFTAITSVNSGAAVDGGAGNDVITGSSTVGMDLRGGAGDDQITGGGGNDIITGGLGNDILKGGSGNDTFKVFGTEDTNDSFDGGIGDDAIMATGAAAVTLNSFNATASSIESWIGNGKGVLGTTANNNFDFSGLTSVTTMGAIDGGQGNDTIKAADFASTLLGNAGIDTLIGGSAGDTLNGGAGMDTLTGGGGMDTFVFATGGGKDTVTDYATGDKFDLKGISSLTTYAQLEAKMTETNGDVLITFSAADTLLIENTTKAALSANQLDFMLN